MKLLSFASQRPTRSGGARARIVTSTVLVLTASLVTAAAAAPAVAHHTSAAAPTVKSLTNEGVKPSKATKLRDPSTNLTASPNYLELCASEGPRNQHCINEALKAINNAHAAEGIRKMVLPDDFNELSLPQQTFVITDLERVARGLRPFVGLTAKLNQNAHHAAVVRDDPTLIGALLSLLGIREYASIWAGDFGPLASDYDWMYNDGYAGSGSINIDCRTPGESGCWGHRNAILGLFSGLSHLIAGAGSSSATGSSLAEVLAGTSTRAPSYTYTWTDALAHGANGHKTAVA